MTVVETPVFLRKAALIFDDDERAELVAFVASNPEAGSVVPGTGGVRKLRWAMKGRGKRGGARVIYYFHDESAPIFLLSAYAKSVKVNLSKAERSELQKLVPQLVGSLTRRRAV